MSLSTQSAIELESVHLDLLSYQFLDRVKKNIITILTYDPYPVFLFRQNAFLSYREEEIQDYHISLLCNIDTFKLLFWISLVRQHLLTATRQLWSGHDDCEDISASDIRDGIFFVFLLRDIYWMQSLSEMIYFYSFFLFVTPTCL